MPAVWLIEFETTALDVNWMRESLGRRSHALALASEVAGQGDVRVGENAARDNDSAKDLYSKTYNLRP